MNGNRYLLDTNAIISLLNGNASLSDLLRSSEWVGVSLISKLELFSFPRITAKETLLIKKFLLKIEIINIIDDEEMVNQIIYYRKNLHLKLPDAIIAATAKFTNAGLITNDASFAKINDFKIITP
jgi:tRNA(fMet)-specific endonuclease VapC